MSAGSATIDILLDRIIDTLAGRSGPTDQLIVHGWDTWSELDWQAERERAELSPSRRPEARGARFAVARWYAW